tara:strand:+ start:123 stop:386 length:264 start_codon:yes stop_codon:yes gene_type:complete
MIEMTKIIGEGTNHDATSLFPETWVVRGFNDDCYSITVEEEDGQYRSECYFYTSPKNFWREHIEYGKTPKEAANNLLSNYDKRLDKW